MEWPARPIAPVGRTPASGLGLSEAELDRLLAEGDSVPPTAHALDAECERILNEQPDAVLPMSPDSHLAGTGPLLFDPRQAAEQVVTLLATQASEEDRQELLAGTWLVLGWHNADHPADYGGFLRQGKQTVACYVDIKGTEAQKPSSQRAKLDLRARERKLGCIATTVARVAREGFAAYPGRGVPGLYATVLHNPITPGKQHSGYAMGFFFGIRANNQATDAHHGWGGVRGVKLPAALQQDLEQRRFDAQTTYLDLLKQYRDYREYQTADGWKMDRLAATLEAMYLAGRFLFMNENPALHAEESVRNLQPQGVQVPIDLEQLHPGESLASYYGKRLDKTIVLLEETGKRLDSTQQQLEDKGKRLDIAQQELEDERQRARDAQQKLEDERQRTVELVRLLRAASVPDPAIANQLRLSLADFLQRYPPTS